MTAACFASSYRRSAAYWRRAAADLRAKATPKGKQITDMLAANWEQRARQFDIDADNIEAANRTDPLNT